MIIDPVKIVTVGDMSSSINSIGINVRQFALCSIQAVWTGSPVGNFTVQTSNDIVPISAGSDPASNVVNWTTYTGSSSAAGGSAGDLMYVLDFSPYAWIRLAYTSTSGTGTLNSTFLGKG